MDTNYSDKVMAFDTLFTTNHIQMLKVLLPCLERGMQKQLAVYIKLLELQYTLSFFRQNPYAGLPAFGESFGSASGGTTAGAVEICSEILPYCSPDEKEKLQNIINICRNFENMQEMMQIMEEMKEIFPDMFSGSPQEQGMPFGADGMDLARTMEMLQGIFS